MRSEAISDRIAMLVERVHRAHAARAAAVDEAERRCANADLLLLGEALAAARADLAREAAAEKAQTAAALAPLARRVLADLEDLLVGSEELQRAIRRGRLDGSIKAAPELAPLPPRAEEHLRAWRRRLRRLAAVTDDAQDFDAA